MLSQNMAANRGGKRGPVRAVVYPEDTGIDDLRFAAPGSEGQVRVRYRVDGAEDWRDTPWRSTTMSASSSRPIRTGDAAGSNTRS